ncbi:Hypothetical predicted protein [Pelobates cultripes]|uniref:Uncharacterized protein n=1 Tax=Pelobates cultripes TaxID=61616 RepID=A0AAD1RRH6_PELCU|nr:Hypothetical predicted protein [Pelobates cultripes]
MAEAACSPNTHSKQPDIELDRAFQALWDKLEALMFPENTKAVPVIKPRTHRAKSNRCRHGHLEYRAAQKVGSSETLTSGRRPKTCQAAIGTGKKSCGRTSARPPTNLTERACPQRSWQKCWRNGRPHSEYPRKPSLTLPPSTAHLQRSRLYTHILQRGGIEEGIKKTLSNKPQRAMSNYLSRRTPTSRGTDVAGLPRQGCSPRDLIATPQGNTTSNSSPNEASGEPGH